MSRQLPSRRTVLLGAAALAGAGALPRAGFAQPAPVLLEAAESSRIELAGPGPLALFGGDLPGPTLRVKKGAELAVTLRNTLKEPLSLIWPGVRLPNALDGVPGLTGPVIAPGESRDLRFTPPDSGTFWYRAFSPALARRALAGALVVEDTAPTGYGADHLLFIQAFPPESGVPIFPVNGAISPTLEGPAGGRARVRLVNATALFLRVRVRESQAYVMAVDGQPAQPFALKDGRALLPPGGRVDLAVDLDKADDTVIELETGGTPIQLAILTPAGAAQGPLQGPPPPLPANALPADLPLAGAARFELALGGGAVPLSGFASLGTVKTGGAAVFTLANASDTPAVVHFHGQPVRLLDAKDDGWKPWWLDTVAVGPRSTVRVALQADAPGKWAVIAERGNEGTVVAARSYQVV